jgi:starvation-inducible DNA-binding protein
MSDNFRLKENEHKALVEGLTQLLVDTDSIYIKTRNYHQNVTGAVYRTFHKMFENQYAELTSAFDLIAERIRALGVPAPTSQVQFNNSKLRDEKQSPAKSQDMIKDLLEDQEMIIRRALCVFPLAEKARDRSARELMVLRILAHEKTASTLRDLLIN